MISGFSIIVLCQAVRWIPRQLEDAARLDGCGWFGTYWHVLLPLVRRELWLIGFLTLIGTSVLLATPLVVFDGGFLTQVLARLLPVWQGGLAPTQNVGLMMGASLVATLPVIVVFLFAKGSAPAKAENPLAEYHTHLIARGPLRFRSRRQRRCRSSIRRRLPFPIPKSLRLSGAVVTRHRVVAFFAADCESPRS